MGVCAICSNLYNPFSLIFLDCFFMSGIAGCDFGFYILPEFISVSEEAKILQEVEGGNWKSNRDGSLRIQIYGPWHDEQYRIKPNGPVTPLPEYTKEIIRKICTCHQKQFPNLPLKEGFGQEEISEVF